MSLLDRFRPRWKHRDPAVRRAGVCELRDQELLREIAESDEDPSVRAAAIEQLSDPDVLMEFARGNGPMNLRALARLSDPRKLAALARSAASVEVRNAAIDRVEDMTVLQQIASVDPDPALRQRAKRKYTGGRMRDYLRAELQKLSVGEPKPAESAELAGSLDDLCVKLIGNERFQITGVVDEHHEIAQPVGTSQTVGARPGNAATATHRTSVELIAVTAGGGSTPPRGAQQVFYRIKIWRAGENAYQGRVEERRRDITNDVKAWSESSNSP